MANTPDVPADAPEEAPPLPEGQTVTPDHYEASVARLEAAQAAPPDLTKCVNDGEPALCVTANPGQVPVAYCDACSQRLPPAVPLESVEQYEPGNVDGGGPGNVIRLVDGSTTADRRLDRVKQFDPRSRSFPMAEVLQDLAPKSYKPRSHTWACDVHLDQGAEGSCVGHAWAHEMIAKPVVIDGIDHAFASWVYKTAQKYDPWPGENYEGTSTLAGAKVCQQRPPKMPEGRGLMQEYRWIFGDMDELIKTLGYFGPVVLGTNWYGGMMKPDSDGFIHCTGDVVGGHCILIKGVQLPRKSAPAGTSGAVRLHQSWGKDWGQGGDCWLSLADLETLLADDGELCVPVHRLDWGG